MPESQHKTPPYREKKDAREVFLSLLWFKHYSLLVLSSVMLAAGFVYFIIPHEIVPGGVVGLGIVINHLTGLPIGMTAFIINVPLIYLGGRTLGFGFGVKTVLGLLLSSVFIDILTIFIHPAALSQDILVSAVFGGVLIGGSVALVISVGAAAGGTALAARIISYKTDHSTGRILLALDGMIVMVGLLVFGNIEMAPYAVITIFTISRSVDAIMSGLDTKKAVFIISDRHEDIRDFILNEIDRGGTYLTAKGLYFDDRERKLIFSAMNRGELTLLKKHVKKIDPDAFLLAVDTKEIFGRGYRQLG